VETADVEDISVAGVGVFVYNPDDDFIV